MVYEVEFIKENSEDDVDILAISQDGEDVSLEEDIIDDITASIRSKLNVENALDSLTGTAKVTLTDDGIITRVVYTMGEF